MNHFLVIIASAIAVTAALHVDRAVLAQQEEQSAKRDSYPAFFKVYSDDAAEVFSVTCTPTHAQPIVDQVTCEFAHVRFQFPSLGAIDAPTSSKELLEQILEADPSLADEVRSDPAKAEQEILEGLEEAKQHRCSPEGRASFEARIRDPKTGPKMKAWFERVIAACSEKDPTLFLQLVTEPARRTCDLWVDRFTLDFTKVKEGQWLYRQEAPNRLTNVLKVYELTGDGFDWTFSETRVPTEGSEEKPVKTVWSGKNRREYEPPCDFVSFASVQFP